MKVDRRMLVMALLGLASCARPQGQSVNRPDVSRHAAPPASAQPSIYDLDIPLVGADGVPAALSGLRGRTVIASMIYTSCAAVCPRTIEDMRAIERRLPARVRGSVTFALFSLDPGRDTPQALRRFAAERRLDTAGWRLFAAKEDDVRTLAAMMGVKYARETSGEVAHSALIVVIDAEGVVRHRQSGLSNGPDAALQAIAAAGLAF